jgi:Uma2 family endonuclease
MGLRCVRGFRGPGATFGDLGQVRYDGATRFRLRIMSSSAAAIQSTPAAYWDLAPGGLADRGDPEYHNGAILPRPPVSAAQQQIFTTVAASLWFALRGTSYESLRGEVRLWIDSHDGRRGSQQHCFYPDLMVVEGEILPYENRANTLLNPCLIVEALAPATALISSLERFKAYRLIPELQEYVLIDPLTLSVQRFRQSQGQWGFEAMDLPEETVRFETIGVTMTLAEIYEGVTVEPLA